MGKIKNFLFKNTSTKQTVAKNTIWLFVGEILGRLLKLVLLILATRLLGVAGWGVFSYALAFVSLWYIFADIGINTFITRELSKEHSDQYAYISAALILKIIILVISLSASVLLIPHLSSIALSFKIILALGLLSISDAIREFAFSINRAAQKMEREALVKFILNASVCVLGIILLFIHPTALSLALAYALGSIIATAVIVVILLPEYKNIPWKFPPRLFRIILDFSWPFVATTIFLTVIANIDTIMLGQMKSSYDVGLYAAAERIIQFLVIIPMYISMATFPAMTTAESETATATRIFEKTMTVLFAIGIPLAFGGFLLSSSLMTLLFGSSYAAGSLVLAILMLCLLADFPNMLLSNAIFAKNVQKKFVIITCIGMLVNIAMNFYLIPRFGAIGAACSTTITQLCIMLANWYMLKRYMTFEIIPKLKAIGIATVSIVIVILICINLHIPAIAIILLAVALYGTLLYWQKEPSLLEIIQLVKKF